LLFNLSPTTPKTCLTPAAIKTLISWSATEAVSYFLPRGPLTRPVPWIWVDAGIVVAAEDLRDRA
jgi:hypothetical protein